MPPCGSVTGADRLASRRRPSRYTSGIGGCPRRTTNSRLGSGSRSCSAGPTTRRSESPRSRRTPPASGSRWPSGYAGLDRNSSVVACSCASAHTSTQASRIPLEDRLLLGLEYSNGHRASTLQDMRMLGPGAGAEGQPLMLVQQSGGGGEQSVDQTYWVSPLPHLLGVPAASRGAGDLRPGLAGLRYAGVPDGPRQRAHPRRRRPQPTALAAATGHRATGAAVPTPPILRVVRRAARLTGLHRLRGVQHAPR